VSSSTSTRMRSPFRRNSIIGDPWVVRWSAVDR